MKVLTDKRGRKYVRYDDGRVSFAADDVAQAMGERASKPSKAGKGDCKVVTAVQLHARPAMDICNDELIPVAQGLIDALLARSGEAAPAAQLVAAADAAANQSCCEEGQADFGRELATVLVQELIRRRMSPADWLTIMPEELVTLQAAGATQDAAEGTPLADVADGLGVIWQRLTGAISGAALGARFGTPGSVIGGLIGAVFPELLDTAAGMIGSDSQGRVDLDPPGEQLQLLQGEKRGARDVALANAGKAGNAGQAAPQGAGAFVNLGPVGFGVNNVDLKQLLG